MTFMQSVHSEPSFPPLEISLSAKPASSNTMIREHSSLKEASYQPIMQKRTLEYPTQIVRMEGELKGAPLSCNEVFQRIDNFFSKHITHDRFFYNTIYYCSYDPDTHLAKNFTINSYFDPLDDDAIAYLKKYIDEHNGQDLLGSPFYIESAQALIVSLDIDAGLEDIRNDSTLLRLQHDNASHYFLTNYAMRLDLIADVRQRFFSHERSLVLPFLNKWISKSAWIYERILSNSNYIELRPELIFLMDKSPKIFTPLLRLYYGHHCSKYENKYCL